MANTLGLDGDLDDVELLRSVENAFDVKIADDEAQALHTVGDLFDLLVTKISPSATDRKCASVMAFYRLRRALRENGVDGKAPPAADISALSARYTKTFVRDLEKKAGLKLPKPVLTWIGWAGIYALFAAVFGSLLLIILGVGLHASHWDTQWVSRATKLLFFGGVALGPALLWLDRGRLSDSGRTLGALADETAKLSYGLLVKQGADASEQRIWRALVAVLADHAVGIRPEDITRETYFLDSQLKKAKTAA